MSKHRHRELRGINNYRNNSSCNNNSENNQPFGINIQQLLNMLGGNIDINGVAKILSSMNMNGFNLNTINNQMGVQKNNEKFTSSFGEQKQRADEEEDIENIDEENIDIENINEENTDIETIDIETIDEASLMEGKEDENIKFLNNIRKIVDSDKQIFIKQIIEMYKRGNLINK